MSGQIYPAPWTWDGTYPITILDADGHYVVNGGMMPSGSANARLIAAAPDLLAALRECSDRLRIHMKHTEDLVADMKAQKAITKAEGR